MTEIQIALTKAAIETNPSCLTNSTLNEYIKHMNRNYTDPFTSHELRLVEEIYNRGLLSTKAKPYFYISRFIYTVLESGDFYE